VDDQAMATITKDITVGTTPDQAWEALRDYGAVHERVAPGFVTATTLDGDARIVTFANGAVAREQLVTLDDAHQRLVYAVVDSPLAARHQQASVEVLAPADGEAGCRVRWTTDVVPDELAPIIDGLMDLGAAAIARTLAA
jgi:hypothetical protein